jgi:hypothetical protein
MIGVYLVTSFVISYLIISIFRKRIRWDIFPAGSSGLIIGKRAIFLSLGILFLILTIGMLELSEYKDFNILYLLLSFIATIPLASIFHKKICK